MSDRESLEDAVTTAHVAWMKNDFDCRDVIDVCIDAAWVWAQRRYCGAPETHSPPGVGDNA